MLMLSRNGIASAVPLPGPSSSVNVGCLLLPYSTQCRRHRKTRSASAHFVQAATAALSAPGQADAPAARPRGIVDVAEHIALNSIAAELLPADESSSAPAAKCLLVLSGGRPLLLIMLAQHRVDERRLAALTLSARRALRLATPAEVLALSGFAVGAVPPFGYAAALPTLLDAAVRFCTCTLAKDVVHACKICGMCMACVKFGGMRQVHPHPTLLPTCMSCLIAACIALGIKKAMPCQETACMHEKTL